MKSLLGLSRILPLPTPSPRLPIHAISDGRRERAVGGNPCHVKLGAIESKIAKNCPLPVRGNRDTFCLSASNRVASDDFLADERNVAATNGIGTDRAIPVGNHQILSVGRHRHAVDRPSVESARISKVPHEPQRAT